MLYRLLDKYIGDAIVPLWGAPLPIGNHAQHTVEGAIKMMNLLLEYKLAYKLFLRKDFDEAKKLFEIIENDKPSKRLNELCTKYINHPELEIEGFDVTKMTEK